MNALVAVELDQETDSQLVSKAIDLTKNIKANLHILHVIEPIYTYGITPPLFVDPKQYKDQVAKIMSDLGSKFNISKEFQYLKVGQVDEVIAHMVKAIDANLLVMGNHGRHGFNALFNSNHTTNLVKNMECDMLAVRVA